MTESISWPDSKRFALCLTHDVDRVDKSWWHCAYYFLTNSGDVISKDYPTQQSDTLIQRGQFDVK